MKILDLFAGIGGFSYAAHYLGVGQTTQFVEINPYCQKVLSKNFPNVPIYNDITTYNPLRGEFDIITFGSPCQDVSSAGKQTGIHGDRSGLFFHAVRIVKQVQPRGFIMENVIGIRKWQKEVLNELQEIGGYNLCWFSISVKQLGGCHQRERWFCIGWRDFAYSRHSEGGNSTQQYQEREREILPRKSHNENKIRCKTTGCDCLGGFANVTDPESVRSQATSKQTSMWTSGKFTRIHTANSDSSGKSRNATEFTQERTATEISSCRQSTEEKTFPRICREDDGISRKLDSLINQLMPPVNAHQYIKNGTASDERNLKDRSKRIQALGNAVTPQQAGVCFYILSQLMN